MMRGCFFVLSILALCFSLRAEAYLLPCSHIIERVTKARAPHKHSVVYVSVYKPAENSHSVDELLSEHTLIYSEETPASAWPTLALLLESQGEKLLAAVRQFGLPLPAEKDLLRDPPEKYKEAKDLPQPFYLEDEEVSLHRFRNTYAWACEDNQKLHAIWVEKDNFIPQEIHGPCPEDFGPGEPQCVIALQNTWNLKETKNARLIVKRGDKNLYVVKIDHVILNATDAQLRTANAQIQKTTVDKSIGALLNMIQ